MDSRWEDDVDAKIKRLEEDLTDVFERRLSGMETFTHREIHKVVSLFYLYHYQKGPSATPPHVLQFVTDASIQGVKWWLEDQLGSIESKDEEPIPYLIPVLAEHAIPRLMDDIESDSDEENVIPFSNVAFELPEATAKEFYGDTIFFHTKDCCKAFDFQGLPISASETRRTDGGPGSSNIPAPSPSSSSTSQEILTRIDALEKKLDIHAEAQLNHQNDSTAVLRDALYTLRDTRSVLESIQADTASLLELRKTMKAIRKSGRYIQKKVNRIRRSQRRKGKAVARKSIDTDSTL